MIIYFDLQPEYRKKLAELLGSTESNLEPFYSALESEVAWHLALGGLRESELSDEVILGQLKDINQAVVALGDALENMSPDVFGWLIDHAPVGLDYQMPFRVVKKPLKVIQSMTGKAVQGFQRREMTAKRSTSVDFIRKIASCCEKTFGSRPDLESELFYNIVHIMFQSLAISEQKDIRALILQVMRPPAVVLAADDENDENDEKAEITVPENYLNSQNKTQF
jgi:hypothetical protein